MRNTYPIGTTLTFVWRFQYPNGSPIAFTSRNSFVLKYVTGRGTDMVDTFFVNADADGITWTFKADEQFFAGSYGLVLDIFYEGKLLEHCYYRDAFSLYKSANGTMSLTQFERSEVVDLLTVGEFYHFMTGEVINFPDEEDITSGTNNLLKFKDRTPENGMGYVILRSNKSFAEQLTREDTIYEIRYDFDLDGESVSIPTNSILQFNGGSLSNGTLSGSFYMYGNTKNNTCSISGSILNKYYMYDTGSAAINASIIQSCRNGVELMEDIETQSCTLHSSINGNNHVVEFANTDGIDAFVLNNTDNITIENIRFKKDSTIADVYKTHIVKIADCNDIVIRNCYSEGGVNIRTTTAYWNANGETCRNFVIDNCQFNIDWTPINNINPDQMIQDDIVTIMGIANAKITNNHIDFKNVNRVFKLTAFRTTLDYDSFDNIAETILIENNHIVGVNEIDNGKQMIDCFFAGTHLKLDHNYIDIKGHFCILQDKSKASEAVDEYEYRNLHTITNNIIKYDNSILNIVEENRLSLVFKENYCLCGTPSAIGFRPIDIAYCRNVIIGNNIFESASNPGAYIEIRDMGNTQSAATCYIKNMVVENNVFDAASYIIEMASSKNISIDYLNISNNNRALNTAIMRTTQTTNIAVNISTLIIEDTLIGSDSGYPISFTENVTIGYLKINMPYVLGRRVLQVNASTTITCLDCNLSVAGGINKTALPEEGSTYDQNNRFNNAKEGTEFYNTSTHTKVYKDAEHGIWRDSSGRPDVRKSGTSSQRPANLTTIDTGYSFFDTDLGKPIYAKTISSDGTVTSWVDAAGTVV